MDLALGRFGDRRLEKRGADLLARLVAHGARGVRVRRFGGDRAGEIRITRFLRNPCHGRSVAADVLQVLLDELLDVALVAPLRPAALIVLSRHLVAVVGDLLEPPVGEPEDPAPLAIQLRDERLPLGRHERQERGERELAVGLDVVLDGVRHGHDAPEVLAGRDEHSHAERAVAVELGVGPLADAIDPGPDGALAVALVVGVEVVLLDLRQQRVEPGRDRAGRRRLGRVEAHVRS